MEFGSYSLAPRLFSLLINQPPQSISRAQYSSKFQPRPIGLARANQMILDIPSTSSPALNENQKKDTQNLAEQTAELTGSGDPDNFVCPPSPGYTAVLPTPCDTKAQENPKTNAEDPHDDDADAGHETSGRVRKSSESTLSEFDPSDLSSVSSMWSEYTNEVRKSSSSFQGSSEHSMRSNYDCLESSENEERRGKACAGPREKRSSRGQHKRRSFSMSSEGDSASSTEVPPENETLPARSPSSGRPKSRLKGVERGHPDKRDRAGRTPLIKYANLGDLDSCEELLQLGAAINVRDNAGWTALHEAALAGHYTLLNVLLRHGAELNIRADNGDTPLHDSVQNGHIDCVQALLEAGADPEISNDEGVTPITAADDGVMLELLRQYQALRQAAKVRDKSGRAALHRAAAEGLLQDAVAILRYGGEVDAVDYAGRTALHEACLGGHVDVVKALLASGAGFDVDSAGLTPLHHAIRGRHLDCVRELLIAGANPWTFDQDGKTAFDLASDFPPASDMLSQWRFFASKDKERASNGDVSSVYWRMAGRDAFSGSTQEVFGPDGDSSSSRKLQHTQQDAEGRRERRGSMASGFSLRPRRRPQYAERMVDSEDDGSNYSEDGSSSSLSSAGEKNDAGFMPSKSSSTKGVPYLVKRKTTPRQAVDVPPSSKERRSPCKRQRRDTSGSGITPLHVYASKSDGESMRALLANGTDPSPRDNAGYTPLHEAALRGHAEVVQALIAAGADVAARGYEGDTPLHDAAQNGHRKVYRILVKAGADEDALNVKGQRPRDFLKFRDDSAVKQQLKARDRPGKRKGDTRRRCRSEGAQSKTISPAQEKLGALLPDGRRQESPALTDASSSTKLRRLSGSEQSSEFKKPLDRIYSKSASPEKGARSMQRGSSPASGQPGARAVGEFSAVKEEKSNRQAEPRRQRRKKIELSFVGYQRFDRPRDLASQDTGKSVTSSNKGCVVDEGYLPLFVVQLDDDDSGSTAAARRQAAPSEKTTRQLPVELCASLRPLPGKAFFVLDLQLHLLLGFASVPALRSAYPRLAGRELNQPQKSRMWALMSAILSMPLADEAKEADASEERARAWFCGTVVCFLRLDEVVDIIRRDYEHLSGRLTAVTLDVGLTGVETDLGADADPSRASSAKAPMDRRALSRRPRAPRKPFPGLPAKLALKKQRVRLRGDVPDDKAAYGTTSL